MKKKLLAMMTLAAAAVCALVVPMTSGAAAVRAAAFTFVQDETPAVVVILGDSIGTGYGTSGYNSSAVQAQTALFGYGKIIADAKGYDVRDRAVDCAETKDVLARLQNHEDTRADVAEADIINITIGGNDLRAVNTIFRNLGYSYNMTSVIAECRAAENAEEPITTQADIVLDYMRGNIEQILDLIYELNPNALVTVFENYTPAFYAASALEALLLFNIVFGNSDRPGLDLAGRTIISRLNAEVWADCAANYPGTMVLSDAYNEMMRDDNGEHTGQTIRGLFQFDFIHPTDAGHAKLAGILMQTIDSTIRDVAASAFVTKLSGSKNDLTITVVESYFDKTAKVFDSTIRINNNAAGVYAVGDYSVFVNTKGNTQIRDCYLVA